MPPDKFVKPEEEEDLTKPLNAEDEVALLLKEEIGVISGNVWKREAVGIKIEQSLGVKSLVPQNGLCGKTFR